VVRAAAPRAAASHFSDIAAQDAPAAPKIRIKLRSFEHVNLREAGVKIVEAATRTGAGVAGPTPRASTRRRNRLRASRPRAAQCPPAAACTACSARRT
jgi:hypothetical protein